MKVVTMFRGIKIIFIYLYKILCNILYIINFNTKCYMLKCKVLGMVIDSDWDTTILAEHKVPK